MEISQQLSIVDYSDKSFVVYGSATKQYKESLKNLGGRFNSKLKPREDWEGGAAWIYSVSKKPDVAEFVNDVNSGEITSDFPDVRNSNNGLPIYNVPRKEKYQQVKFRIFKPEEGMEVKLNDGSQKEGTVTRTETNNGIVDTAYLELDGTPTMAVISRGKWQIWGYNHKHSLFFE